MTGIEKIAATILEDAKAEAAKLNGETEKKVSAIRQQAETRADQEVTAILARGRKAAQERLERLSSAAGMEAKKLELDAKQQMLGEAFDLALEKLCSLPEQNYLNLLVKLALEASTTGMEQMMFSSKDRIRIGSRAVAAANEALAKNSRTAGLTLSEETRPIKGGFVMADGAVEINCSFETLVRLQRETLEKEVADVLFA